MIEIRKDFISKKKVIINEKRNYRPIAYSEEPTSQSSSCPFCPGFEKKTPPEIDRFEEKKKWTIRVFENKFPILSLQKSKEIKTKIYKKWVGHGNNEVIVLTPDHSKTPMEFSINKWYDVIKMYIKRIEYNNNLKGIGYSFLFHNQGGKSGASIMHSHSQILATHFIPEVILTEMKSCNEGLCCKMIKHELKSNRLVYKNKDFIAFTNYASRFPFEVHIYPKKHVKSIIDLSNDMIHSLAETMKIIMTSYKKEFRFMDFNLAFHNAPNGMDFHFHIEIYPRILKFGGVENGLNVHVNTTSPETSARILRGKIK